MLTVTSSITSGYCDFQLDRGGANAKRWEDIEMERLALTKNAYSEADKILSENGHIMKRWSNVNTSYCTKCYREARISNIYSRLKSKINGPAIEEKCDDSGLYSSKDVFHWEYNNYMI